MASKQDHSALRWAMPAMPALFALLMGCPLLDDDPGGSRFPVSKHIDLARGEMIHVVGRGETLWSIGRLYGTDAAAITRRNRISGDLLEIGDLLAIPVAGGYAPDTAKRRIIARESVGAVTVRPEPTFAWPIAGSRRITRRYGTVIDVGTFKGVDIAASPGAGVLAAKSGRVRYVSETVPGMGRVVILDHGGEEWTFYAHLGAISVAPGDNISRGKQLGTVGRSGRAVTDKLHFRIYRRGRPLDPAPLLR